jgi:hypothetical protein
MGHVPGKASMKWCFCVLGKLLDTQPEIQGMATPGASSVAQALTHRVLNNNNCTPTLMCAHIYIMNDMKL